jgi:hypothetical protein
MDSVMNVLSCVKTNFFTRLFTVKLSGKFQHPAVCSHFCSLVSYCYLI